MIVSSCSAERLQQSQNTPPLDASVEPFNTVQHSTHGPYSQLDLSISNNRMDSPFLYFVFLPLARTHANNKLLILYIGWKDSRDWTFLPHHRFSYLPCSHRVAGVFYLEHQHTLLQLDFTDIRVVSQTEPEGYWSPISPLWMGRSSCIPPGHEG